MDCCLQRCVQTSELVWRQSPLAHLDRSRLASSSVCFVFDCNWKREKKKPPVIAPAGKHLRFQRTADENWNKQQRPVSPPPPMSRRAGQRTDAVCEKLFFPSLLWFSCAVHPEPQLCTNYTGFKSQAVSRVKDPPLPEVTLMMMNRQGEAINHEALKQFLM